MKKVLILGATGMLGHKLLQRFSNGYEAFATIRGDLASYAHLPFLNPENTICGLDAEKFESVESAIRQIGPQVIINAIGIIKQLPSSQNVVKTLMINSIFPHRVAEVAQSIGARFITISTDCVFSGKKGNYNEEDISDAYDLYGKSKNLGEVSADNSLTIRTSIIGRELEGHVSLVDWFLSNEGKNVKGYRNAIYSGFPTIVLADILADLIDNHPDLSGLYHISSEPINKYELIGLIRDAFKVNIEIDPFDDFYSDKSLDSSKFRALTGFIPKDWPSMIKEMQEDAHKCSFYK